MPPDANCLLSVADHCLRSKDYFNVIVADKQPHLTLLDMDDAVKHCTKGIGIWDWASTDAGDGARCRSWPAPGIFPRWRHWPRSSILKEHIPALKLRFVNVVDLFRLMPDTEHPHGLSGSRFRFAVHPGQTRHLQFPQLCHPSSTSSPIAGPIM